MLSHEDKMILFRKLHHNLKNISDALRIVSVVMGFLAAEGGQQNMSLKEYTQKVLRLRKVDFCENVSLCYILHTYIMYNNTQFGIQQFILGNVVSLWVTLAIEKAKQHSLNGKEVTITCGL